MTRPLLSVALPGAGCGDRAAGRGNELRHVRHGGLAGVDGELVVRPSGRATPSSRAHRKQRFTHRGDELPDELNLSHSGIAALMDRLEWIIATHRCGP